MNARVFAGLGIVAVAIGACVIAEPPSDLPTLPPQAPRIEGGSVVPSPIPVLARWPDKFIIPVQLSDGRSELQCSEFVDYNPATGAVGFFNFFTSDPDPTTSEGTTRILEVSIPEPSSDGCHVVEIVVALQLNTGSVQGAHTPGPSGGDSVHWIYSPTGDYAGCPVLDAGLFPDAQALESIDGGSP